MYAAKIGHDAIGISFNPREIWNGARRAALLGLSAARFIEGDLRRLDGMSDALGRFDQAICTETIEHILDDCKLVRDIAGLLRPGGRLLLTTRFKNVRFPDDTITEVENGNDVRWGYTQGDLRALFESCGFEIERQDEFGGIVSYGLIAALRLLSRIQPRVAWLVILPFRVLQLLDRPLTRLLGFPFMTVAIVGVKPAA